MLGVRKVFLCLMRDSSELSCFSFSGLICIPHTEERIGDDGALDIECDGDNSSTFNQDSDAMLCHSPSHCKYVLIVSGLVLGYGHIQISMTKFSLPHSTPTPIMAKI